MKRLKKNDQIVFDTLIHKYISTPIVQSMKQFIQHGNTSTYEHSLNVTETCFRMNRKLRIRANEKILMSAAILHDFYLYDWHEDSDDHRLHGFFHPHKAAVNAKKYFNLGAKECKAIESHMWPLTFRKIPTSREAWILCLADKWCALSETFVRKRRIKNVD